MNFSNYIAEYGPIAVFVLMYSNGVMSTPASEVVLAAVGALVAAQYSPLFPLALAAILGNILGALTLYSVGRRIGYSWVEAVRNRVLATRIIPSFLVSIVLPDEATIEGLARALSRRGAVWIGILRCFPVIRSIVSLPAGMVKMPMVRFAIWSLLGISVWAGFWIEVGFLLQANWRQVGSRVSIALIIVLGIMIVGSGTYVSRRYNR